MQSVVSMMPRCDANGHLDLLQLATHLEQLHFKVRLVGEHATRKGLGGRHGFLLCLGKSMGSAPSELPYTAPTPVIIDPFFKSQFDIQHPSATYAAILDVMPEVFVGTWRRLEELIRLLCREMRRSFEIAQRPLPPWRTLSSMTTRWERALLAQDVWFSNGGSV